MTAAPDVIKGALEGAKAPCLTSSFQAECVVLTHLLIGERPGLSSPDSLGVYLTYAPRPGRTDAERNCISNVRPQGLPYEVASHRLTWLMSQARTRRLSGVELKEEAPALEDAAPGQGLVAG